MPFYDAIVLGTGGVGSAASFQLAPRGARVLGLDQFPGGPDRDCPASEALDSEQVARIVEGVVGELKRRGMA